MVPKGPLPLAVLLGRSLLQHTQRCFIKATIQRLHGFCLGKQLTVRAPDSATAVTKLPGLLWQSLLCLLLMRL